jgi:hypothetical protein
VVLLLVTTIVIVIVEPGAGFAGETVVVIERSAEP